MAVARAGTYSVIADAGSYVADETGSDRVAVFVCFTDTASSNRPLASATYGGKACTVIGGVQSGNPYVGVAFAYLKEADVATRTGDVFDATWTGGTPAASTIVCVTLTGVDQTTPTDATSTDSAVTQEAMTLALTTAAGGHVLVGVISSVGSSDISMSFASASEIVEGLQGTAFNYLVGEYIPGDTSYSETITTGGTASALASSAVSFVAAAGAAVAPLAASYYAQLRA